MSDPALKLREVRRSFVQADNRLDILKGCSLSVAAGEKVALIGPSGSGKSTLLQIAGLLEKPDGGIVEINGRNAAGMDDAERTGLRLRHIGFVYQYHHLLPEFSAKENIMLPQMIAGVSKKQASERAEELLSLVGLQDRASHRPARLSGGEQQRVAIARALANRPCVLIADEPTGNLDPHTAEGVFEFLNDLAKSQLLGLLMATHNFELAQRMDKIYRLNDGILL